MGCGTLQFIADENWTATSHATKMVVGLTPSGALPETVRIDLGSDGMLKLTGTLNQSLPLGCLLTHSAAQSIATGTQVALLFDTEVDDPYAMHSQPSNTTKVNIAEAGMYALTATATYAANTGGSTREISIRRNGTETLARQLEVSSASGSPITLNVATVAKLSAGDYLEVVVYHNAGAAVNINGASATLRTPSFSVYKL